MNRDYVLVFDRSGSMEAPVSARNSTPRYTAMQESSLAITRKVVEFDPDGVDCYFFNDSPKPKFHEQVTPDKVEALFKAHPPVGGTDFVPSLELIAQRHFEKKERPTMAIIITDGAPSGNGERELADFLKRTSNKVESNSELKFAFLQIGDDQAAARFLKALDNELVNSGAKHDIVSVLTFEELSDIGITEALLALINDQ